MLISFVYLALRKLIELVTLGTSSGRCGHSSTTTTDTVLTAGWVSRHRIG